MKSASFSSVATGALLFGTLTAGFLSAPDARACHGRDDPHHPPECRHGHHPPPPPACNIPDNRYYMSGYLNRDTRYSLTLWMVQARPIVLLRVSGQEYLAAAIPPPRHHRGPHHPPRDGHHPPPHHRPGHPPHDRHGPGHHPPRHHGKHHGGHHGEHHGGHHPRPRPPCDDTMLSFKWEPSRSVPSGIGGEIKFQYLNSQLSGSVILRDDAVLVEDNAVILNSTK